MDRTTDRRERRGIPCSKRDTAPATSERRGVGTATAEQNVNVRWLAAAIVCCRPPTIESGSASSRIFGTQPTTPVGAPSASEYVCVAAIFPAAAETRPCRLHRRSQRGRPVSSASHGPSSGERLVERRSRCPAWCGPDSGDGDRNDVACELRWPSPDHDCPHWQSNRADGNQRPGSAKMVRTRAQKCRMS